MEQWHRLKDLLLGKEEFTSSEESSSSALLLRQLCVGEAEEGEGAYFTHGLLFSPSFTCEWTGVKFCPTGATLWFWKALKTVSIHDTSISN